MVCIRCNSSKMCSTCVELFELSFCKRCCNTLKLAGLYDLPLPKNDEEHFNLFWNAYKDCFTSGIRPKFTTFKDGQEINTDGYKVEKVKVKRFVEYVSDGSKIVGSFLRKMKIIWSEE